MRVTDPPLALSSIAPLQWTVSATPAANTNAVAARAAQGAGTRNVVTNLAATLVAGATASGIVTVILSDGVSTFFSGKIRCLINEDAALSLSGLNYRCADNAAVSLTVSAGGVTTEVTANISGYTITE